MELLAATAPEGIRRGGVWLLLELPDHQSGENVRNANPDQLDTVRSFFERSLRTENPAISFAVPLAVNKGMTNSSPTLITTHATNGDIDIKYLENRTIYTRRGTFVTTLVYHDGFHQPQKPAQYWSLVDIRNSLRVEN